MHSGIKKWYDTHDQQIRALALDLWHHPETAMNEYHSCESISQYLSENGFEVNAFDVRGQGNPANAIVAKFGHGKPVIGFLGEYDALDGLGQEAVPYYAPLEGPGHGCGHNMMGTACAAAAVSVREAMLAENLPGTIIYFGCPAEETIEGKPLMIRDGYFDDVDVCIAWHPTNEPVNVSERSLLANTNMLFNFYGKTAHAAGSPHLGRSALDAAELMNMGVQFLREHVPDDVRMHYVYTHGGDKPNIVPEYAQVHYFIRARSKAVKEDVVERVQRIAQGAAMMTDTRVEWQLVSACADTRINHTLNKYFHEALEDVGEISFDEADRAYARTLYQNVTGKAPDGDVLPTSITPLTGQVAYFPQSTDLSDVSQILPTAQLMGLGMVRSLPEHHWSVVSVAGSEIGMKVCAYTSKVMAQCAYNMLTRPEIVEEMKEEHRRS